MEEDGGISLRSFHRAPLGRGLCQPTGDYGMYGGLNEECLLPTQDQVFQYLVLVGGVIWEGYVTFRRWSLAGGSMSLGVDFASL